MIAPCRVVILTGSGDDRELEIQCLAHGAVAFCGKDVFDRLPDLVLAAWQHRSQRRDQLAGITDRLTSISTILSNNARTISCLDAETRRLAEKLDGTDDEPGFITIVRLVDRDFSEVPHAQFSSHLQLGRDRCDGDRRRSGFFAAGRMNRENKTGSPRSAGSSRPASPQPQ